MIRMTLTQTSAIIYRRFELHRGNVTPSTGQSFLCHLFVLCILCNQGRLPVTLRGRLT